jgi:SAM-dependent methyltransferase
MGYRLFYISLSATLLIGSAALAGKKEKSCAESYASAGRSALSPQMAVAIESTLEKNAFKVTRSLEEYLKDLDSGVAPELALRQLLARLGKDDHWIDVGCGTCRALAEFLESHGIDLRAQVSAQELRDKNLPRLTGLMVSDQFSNAEKNPEIVAAAEKLSQMRRNVSTERVNVRVGKKVENYAAPREELGTASLITDVIGAAAYSEQLDEVLFTYGQLLKKGGVALIRHPGAKVKVSRGGKGVAFMDYLNSIEGFKVVELSYDTYALVRTGGKLRVPKLQLAEMHDGTPPYRFYKVLKKKTWQGSRPAKEENSAE